MSGFADRVIPILIDCRWLILVPIMVAVYLPYLVICHIIKNIELKSQEFGIQILAFIGAGYISSISFFFLLSLNPKYAFIPKEIYAYALIISIVLVFKKAQAIIGMYRDLIKFDKTQVQEPE